MSYYALFRGALSRIMSTNWGVKIPGADGQSHDTAVQPFAEEIAAIFSSQGPIQLSSPLQFQQMYDGPLMQVELSKPSGQEPIQVNFDGQQLNVSTGGGGQQQPQRPTSFVGTVIEIQAPGQGPYLMQTSDGKKIEVFQAQIDPSETIPLGTFAIVIRDGRGKYWMQVPVWLPD